MNVWSMTVSPDKALRLVTPGLVTMRTFPGIMFLAVLLAAGPAHAAEPQPRFATPQITAEQWRQYLTEVQAIPGIERRDSARQITLTDARTMTIYAFTQEANPAHPAHALDARLRGEVNQ